MPQNNRSQVVQTKTNLLLMDAYNANPSSMRAAILNFAQMNQPNKMAILGDMLELGNDSEKEHKAIVELLLEKNITCVFLVGPEFEKHASTINARHFNTSEAAANFIAEHPINNSSILIKGSRGIKLEKVAESL